MYHTRYSNYSKLVVQQKDQVSVYKFNHTNMKMTRISRNYQRFSKLVIFDDCQTLFDGDIIRIYTRGKQLHKTIKSKLYKFKFKIRANLPYQFKSEFQLSNLWYHIALEIKEQILLQFDVPFKYFGEIICSNEFFIIKNENEPQLFYIADFQFIKSKNGIVFKLELEDCEHLYSVSRHSEYIYVLTQKQTNYKVLKLIQDKVEDNYSITNVQSFDTSYAKLCQNMIIYKDAESAVIIQL
ncbi:hypothetical protein pb186bvf_015482 [Paramecium bursaria]